MIVGLEEKAVFCFGSNLGAVHGAGAALAAVKHFGAVHGVGFGYAQKTAYNPASRRKMLVAHSFAIPTKDWALQTLPLEQIKLYVESFLAFAKANKNLTFKMTQIGCGLAGYEAADIAPMFAEYEETCRSNITYDTAWAPFLQNQYTKFWGSA